MSGLSDESQKGQCLFKRLQHSAVSLLALRYLFRETSLVGTQSPSRSSSQRRPDKHGHCQHLQAGPSQLLLGYGSWGVVQSGGGRKNILLSLGNLQNDFPPWVCADEISISHPCLQVTEPIHGLGSDPRASVWREGCGSGNTWRECSILFNLALPTPNPSSECFFS